MNIWIVTVGEPIPTDAEGVRLLRSGILASLLHEKGHKVTWWNSSFDHNRRILRTNRTEKFCFKKDFDIFLLYGGGYKKNISFQRFYDHYLIAREFKKESRNLPKPDIILCSLPTVELSYQVAKYKKEFKIPYLLDIRDLWPDIFYDYVPGFLRPLLKLILYPLQYQVTYACKNADGILGHTGLFVDWGISRAERAKSFYDRDFPFGYPTKTWPNEEIQLALENWRARGISHVENGLIVCFFGTIASQFDLETVIKAASILEGKGYSFKFVLCGDGDYLHAFKELANGVESIVFPGWVDSLEIRALLELADLGIAPYFNNAGFGMSLPNKIIEYLSGGIPIISSLEGFYLDFIKKFHCGWSYKLNDPQELANLLERILENKNELKKYSENAEYTFNKYFRAEDIYSDMIKHLEVVALSENAEIGK